MVKNAAAGSGFQCSPQGSRSSADSSLSDAETAFGSPASPAASFSRQPMPAHRW
jgi:hypothetical protein